MTVKELSEKTGWSMQYIRCCIQMDTNEQRATNQKRIPFATGIKMSTVWTYCIDDDRFKLWKEGNL